MNLSKTIEQNASTTIEKNAIKKIKQEQKNIS